MKATGRDAGPILTLLSDTTTLKPQARTTRLSRPIQWIKAALKGFQAFPEEAQLVCLRALTIAGEGDKADIAKPTRGIKTPKYQIDLITDRIKRLKQIAKETGK